VSHKTVHFSVDECFRHCNKTERGCMGVGSHSTCTPSGSSATMGRTACHMSIDVSGYSRYMLVTCFLMVSRCAYSSLQNMVYCTPKRQWNSSRLNGVKLQIVVILLSMYEYVGSDRYVERQSRQ
jgi:hypothetical protein